MEQNHTPPSPIAGEPAKRTPPMEIAMVTIDGVDWQLRRIENISSCLLEALSGHNEVLNIRTAFLELKALEDHIKGIALHNE